MITGGPAVYAFENIEDRKLYIGSSINARRRVQHHLFQLRHGKHHNRYFQRAYDKHGGDKFQIFVLDALPPDCTSRHLLEVEQQWISTLSTTDPELGYNIHPTAIASDYVAPAQERLQQSLAGRKRGVLSEAGRASQDRARRLAWQRPGEREYRGEILRDIWATPEHRAKMGASVTERLADPDALAAMRARMAAVSARRTTESHRHDAMQAWWQRNASDKFPSNEAMTDWIIAQYQSGMSARQIGLALGMTHHAVTYRLKMRGIELPKRGIGRQKLPLSMTRLARKGITDIDEFDRQVAALRAEGNSVNAIRLAYGLSHEAIRNSLQRSLPTRSPSSVNVSPPSAVVFDCVLYLQAMTTIRSIPTLIEAARAGALLGKEFVVEAEAYRAAARLRALNSRRDMRPRARRSMCRLKSTPESRRWW